MGNQRAADEAALYSEEGADYDEVVVSGSNKPPKRKLPNPWKVMWAGAPAGPLGMLGVGLATHFRNKSILEKEAERDTLMRGERDQLQSTIEDEFKIADPDEKRLLGYLRKRVADGFARIAAGESSGYDIIEKANQAIEGLIGGDIKARKEEMAKQNDFQRGLIGDSAKSYREEYQSTHDTINAIYHQSQKILSLVADKNFDPNKPINKAHLAELLSMGGLMFKDSPDMLDAVTQGAGGLGAAGPWGAIASSGIGGIMTAIKAGDFKVTPEDYNRLALNMQKYGKIYADKKMETLGNQASSLDKWGKQLGVIPEDYSLGDYISGGEKELRMTPNPTFTGGFQEDKSTPTATDLLTNPTEAGRKLGVKARKFFGWGEPPLIQRKRPTN